METNKQVVVITGSSGRVGTRLIETIAKEYQCVGLDFVGIPPVDPALEFVYVDLGSDLSVEQAFKRIKYAYGNTIASIVHLAAYYSFTGENLELYDKITVKGTERLLKASKDFNVEQFIFTSTMLVHNPTPRGQVLTEDVPIEGKWHYPASKVKTEKLLLEQHKDVPLVILRIAGCYDEGCNCIPISQHIVRIYEKQLAGCVFPGNVHHGVPYIHFDDLSDMIHLLIKKRKDLPKEEVFFCCEEDSISYYDLQQQIAQLLYNKHWPMIQVPKWFAKAGAWAQGLLPGDPPFIKPWMVDLADDNYEISMDASRKALGWSPQRQLRNILPRIIQNMKDDPIAWYKRHKIPVSNFVLRHANEKGKV